MHIGLNRLHFPVTALGPGRRLGVWLQGCGIGCPGCLSRDTWARDEQSLVDVSMILDWCRAQEGARPDGVTISGGEPFEQPEALGVLLDGLTSWRQEAALPMDFLCYSGLPMARLRRDFGGLLSKLDAVIPEPFVRTRPTDQLWRGSSNQVLVPLSETGRERYGQFVQGQPAEKRNFQVQVESGRLWFIGVPSQGDMEKLEEACAARGITMESVSWRA